MIETVEKPPSIPSPRPPLVASGYRIGFCLVVSLFLLWAVANNFNDILIRQFQKALDLDRAQAGLIQFVFYIGYFVMALPAGLIMRRFGYRAGILLGLSLYAIGALLFYPAAEIRQYAAFLSALFILACGAACLETAANPYVVAFGDPSRAAQRLNLAQAFNGVGAVIAPILGGLFIFSGVDLDNQAIAALEPAALEAWRASEARTVQAPYLILALIVIAVAIGVSRVRLPPPPIEEDAPASSKAFGRLIRNRVLVGAVVAQFFYVGAQVGIWSYFVDFATFASSGVSERTAAFLLSASLALFMIGRFAGTALMGRTSPVSLLIGCALANILLCALAAALPGPIAIAALVGTGLFMSIQFPTLFALGVRDLGPDQSLGASLLIMAIIGGALLPPLMGWISHGHGGLRLALSAPLIAFGVVAAFGFYYRRVERAALLNGVRA